MTILLTLRTNLARIGREFAADTRGATAIEYAIMAAGIGVAVAATVWALGSNVNLLFTNVSNGF